MTNHDVEGCPQGSSGGTALSVTSMLDRDTLLVTVLLEQVRTEGDRETFFVWTAGIAFKEMTGCDGKLLVPIQN